MRRSERRRVEISVVIPTCNRAHTLARALDSVLAQTLPAREIVVVDDGSQDATAALVRDGYPGVTYLHQANHGVSHARNRGIAAARCEWLALLDSDDAWLPDKLAAQAQALRAGSPRRLCHCDELWVRNGRRVNPMRKHAKHGGWVFEHCLPRCAISPSAVVVHRSLLEECGGFDESLPVCEDYDLWLRICARHAVAFVPRPLVVKYGGHADQLSRRHWGMDRFRVRALEKLLAQGELSLAQQHAVRRVLADKLDVLLGGAAKRGNAALLAELAPKRARLQQHPAAGSAS